MTVALINILKQHNKKISYLGHSPQQKQLYARHQEHPPVSITNYNKSQDHILECLLNILDPLLI